MEKGDEGGEGNLNTSSLTCCFSFTNELIKKKKNEKVGKSRMR